MRILILGGDGYLGWPTAMHFAMRGHDVAVVDNFIKRRWEEAVGAYPLWSVTTMMDRAVEFQRVTGSTITTFVGDLQDLAFVREMLSKFAPEAIVDYAEQCSAPYSMIDVDKARETQVNNVIGTLNLVWSIAEIVPQCHLVKLGTMGEYGTPNIDIEEGYITISHKGRQDRLPYPKQPGSFYHLSKVHDSHNLLFAARIWGLRVTDLNQGVVYGTDTDQTRLSPALRTSFHYDAVFGTALNRFCVQAVAGLPLTVYGRGGQTRGFLNIRDTLECVDLAVSNPATPGEVRVFNQFTEQFTVAALADIVCRAGEKVGLAVKVGSIPNPRVEEESHYYRAVHTGLLDLGLKPHLLSDELIKTMLVSIMEERDHIDASLVLPKVWWRRSLAESEAAAAEER